MPSQDEIVSSLYVFIHFTAAAPVIGSIMAIHVIHSVERSCRLFMSSGTRAAVYDECSCRVGREQPFMTSVHVEWDESSRLWRVFIPSSKGQTLKVVCPYELFVWGLGIIAGGSAIMSRPSGMSSTCSLLLTWFFAGQATEKRTAVMKKNCNPVFKESFSYHGITERELAGYTLRWG